MTCSSIIRLHHLPQRTSRHASKWVVARSQGATCHLWQLPSAEAYFSFGLEHRCPCTGTVAPQLPFWLQRSQDQSLQASVGWDSHEGSSPQFWGKCVWQPWYVSHSWLIPETWEVGVSHFHYPSCTITASAQLLCHSSKLLKTLKSDATNPGSSLGWGMTGFGRRIRAAKLVSREFSFWELQEENIPCSRG